MGWAGLLDVLIVLMWLGAAVWVYLDARRAGRPALGMAIAVALIPGVALAVYLGTRTNLRSQTDDELSSTGQSLLRDLTDEVKRLRARVAELESEEGARRG